jgi:phage tail sheath gpL-like
MSVKFVVTVSGADKTPFVSGAKRSSFRRFTNFLQAIVTGKRLGAATTVEVRNAAVAATGTVVFGGVPTANDTITVAGTVFTAKASASLSTEYTIGASAALSAVAFAAKVNAHTTVSKYVTASVVSATVTLTANVPGVIGNLIAVSESGTNTSIGAAATALTGGAEDTLISYSL